jgi:hypothetical protein
MIFKIKFTEPFFVRLYVLDDRVLYIHVQQLVEEYRLLSLNKTKNLIRTKKWKKFFFLHHLMIDVGRDRCFAFFHACNFYNDLKIIKYQTIRINQLEKPKNTLAYFSIN